MHHRKLSSLAAINGMDRPGAVRSTSSTVAKASRTLSSQSQPLASFSEPLPIFRRRLGRSLFLLLTFTIFLILVLMSGYFDGTPFATTSNTRYPFSRDYAKNANRPYPPNTALGRPQPPEDNGGGIGFRPVPNRVTYKGSDGGGGDGGGGPTLKLTLAEELGAVVAYLTSLGANAHIPTSIDPSQPLDADLILGFNTRSSRASAEVAELVRETWQITPVVLFGEARHPSTRELKQILDTLNLSPRPVFIFLDERDDSPVLTPLVQRLTGGKTMPILLVAGRHQGDFDDIMDLYKNGRLEKRLIAAGATSHPIQARKRRRRQ